MKVWERKRIEYRPNIGLDRPILSIVDSTYQGTFQPTVLVQRLGDKLGMDIVDKMLANLSHVNEIKNHLEKELANDPTYLSYRKALENGEKNKARKIHLENMTDIDGNPIIDVIPIIDDMADEMEKYLNFINEELFNGEVDYSEPEDARQKEQEKIEAIVKTEVEDLHDGRFSEYIKWPSRTTTAPKIQRREFKPYEKKPFNQKELNKLAEDNISANVVPPVNEYLDSISIVTNPTPSDSKTSQTILPIVEPIRKPRLVLTEEQRQVIRKLMDDEDIHFKNEEDFIEFQYKKYRENGSPRIDYNEISERIQLIHALDAKADYFKKTLDQTDDYLLADLTDFTGGDVEGALRYLVEPNYNLSPAAEAMKTGFKNAAFEALQSFINTIRVADRSVREMLDRHLSQSRRKNSSIVKPLVSEMNKGESETMGPVKIKSAIQTGLSSLNQMFKFFMVEHMGNSEENEDQSNRLFGSFQEKKELQGLYHFTNIINNEFDHQYKNVERNDGTIMQVYDNDHKEREIQHFMSNFQLYRQPTDYRRRTEARRKEEQEREENNRAMK